VILTPIERAAAYGAAHPAFPSLATSGDWVYGVWVVGNDYRNPSKFYGAYPRGYLRRVGSMFPDARRVLHAFSGSLRRDEARAHLHPDAAVELVDRVPRTPDTTVADAAALPYEDQPFDLVLADPPYSPADAEKYGVRMPDRRRCLRELARVTRPGGNLVWLDTMLPMFRKVDWKLWGTVGLVRSTNHRVRLVSFFVRAA